MSAPTPLRLWFTVEIPGVPTPVPVTAVQIRGLSGGRGGEFRWRR
jgi:hypothetical protein